MDLMEVLFRLVRLYDSGLHLGSCLGTATMLFVIISGVGGHPPNLSLIREFSDGENDMTITQVRLKEQVR